MKVRSARRQPLWRRLFGGSGGPVASLVLEASMRHVSSDTYWLIHNGQGAVAYPHPDEFGWILCVPDAGHDDDKPADLRRLFAYARLHGCAYVNIDFDGPVLDDLPVY